jgi:hypothetical protein
MFDAKKLLDQFLGSNVPGLSGSVRDRAGQATQIAKNNPMKAGAIAAAIFGTKTGRKLAGNAAAVGGIAAIAGLGYLAYKNYQSGQKPEAVQQPQPTQALLPPPVDSPFHPQSETLSNNFALSEMIRPMWDGCVGAGDEAYKAWLKRRKIPNFSWSSQGRGFFTEAAGRDKFDNQEIVNSWYSPHNFKRRDRAIQLAKELGVSPIQIALAYVLNQPLEVIPLIGPRSIAELDNSLDAATITLTKEQVVWLEA